MSRLPLLLLAVLMMLVASCGERRVAGGAADVGRFDAIIPLLEAYRVSAYRYENWCRALEYRRGRFASSSNDNCTAILDGNRREFDQIARRDLETIRSAVRGTGNEVRFLHSFEYDADGKLVRGIFDCSETMEDRVYIYEPNHTLPEQVPPGKYLRPITADWYFQGRTD